MSYGSETDFEDIGREMECYDDSAVVPKETIDKQEPSVVKKVPVRKNLVPSKRLVDGSKPKKSPGVLKQRSPLKMVIVYSF